MELQVKTKLEALSETILANKELEKFYLVFGGHIFFETLYAAVEFDLFTLLSEKKQMNLKQIAESLDIQPQPARILLLGLVSIGLLQKMGDLYANTPMSELLLTSHSPRNVLSYVKLEHHVMYKGMFKFYESLKNNRNVGLDEFKGNEPTLYERLAHDPKVNAIFQEAMHELSVHANEDLANNVDLTKVKFLVDVGGGDATNIIQLAKKFPNLKAAVYELPSVCPIAEKRIQESGLSDRLSVIPGNCFEGEFPKGADCFLFSHFFTIWSPEKDQLLLKKSFAALPKGGQTIVFNMMQNDDGTGPLTAAIGSPYFLAVATGEGMLYSWSEYESWMKTAGFSKVTQKQLQRDHGAIIGYK